MRQEIPHARTSSTISARSAESGARELYELLAVIIGVCEALAAGLGDTPQHAELARVGLIAADRAASLVSELRAQGPACAPLPAIAQPAGPLAGLPHGQAEARALAMQAAAMGPARKVLLVEDDPDLLNLLTAAFVREGFETYCARNGRIGVDLLITLKPDLMVTDIVMPQMEGIAAILEARRASPHTRVIAISGGGHYGKSQNFLAWARELGADEVLAKPFRMSSLITAARVVLDRPLAPVPANETLPQADVRETAALGRHPR